MTEEVISKLPEILKQHICTVKKASLDDSNKNNMSESQLKVINFDKIPNEYARGKGWLGVPKSNDALYIEETGGWNFIEFKNGSIKYEDIYRKLYDSIIMMMEEKIIPDFQFIREHINYILVYNSDKYSKIQKSRSLDKIYNYTCQRAKKEEKLFGIENFEKYLFKETHTYSKEDFKLKFIEPMEKREGLS